MLGALSSCIEYSEPLSKQTEKQKKNINFRNKSSDFFLVFGEQIKIFGFYKKKCVKIKKYWTAFTSKKSILWKVISSIPPQRISQSNKKFFKKSLGALNKQVVFKSSKISIKKKRKKGQSKIKKYNYLN